MGRRDFSSGQTEPGPWEGRRRPGRAASWSGGGGELNLSVPRSGEGAAVGLVTTPGSPRPFTTCFFPFPPFRFSPPRSQAAQGSIHRARSRWRRSRLSPSLTPHWGGSLLPSEWGGTNCSPPFRSRRAGTLQHRGQRRGGDGTAPGQGSPRRSAAAAPRRCLRRLRPPSAVPRGPGRRRTSPAAPAREAASSRLRSRRLPAPLGPPAGGVQVPALGEEKVWDRDSRRGCLKGMTHADKSRHRQPGVGEYSTIPGAM